MHPKYMQARHDKNMQVLQLRTSKNDLYTGQTLSLCSLFGTVSAGKFERTWRFLAHPLPLPAVSFICITPFFCPNYEDLLALLIASGVVILRAFPSSIGRRAGTVLASCSLSPLASPCASVVRARRNRFSWEEPSVPIAAPTDGMHLSRAPFFLNNNLSLHACYSSYIFSIFILYRRLCHN